jgi:hypothetical protein
MLPTSFSTTPSSSLSLIPLPESVHAPRQHSEESAENTSSSFYFERTSLIALFWSSACLYASSEPSIFLSNCLRLSRNRNLPIDARVQLLSRALLQHPSDNPLNALFPLQHALQQEKELLILQQQTVTIQIEAICARFLPEELHPIGRTPFINGYRCDFYLEILTNVTDWLVGDIKLSPEERIRGNQLETCLQKTRRLLSLAVQEQNILDTIARGGQAPPANELPITFERQLLYFIEEAKLNEEFWLPLTCLNGAEAHYHIILLRLHKATDATSFSPALWRVSLINLGLGAIVPPWLKEKHGKENVCQDFEVVIPQNLLTLSSLTLLKNTFENPKKLYGTIFETLFNRHWGLGKERTTFLSIGLCATQTWHVLVQDFLNESIYSRLMSFWIAREVQKTRLQKLLTGHLGSERTILTIGQPPCDGASAGSSRPSLEYRMGRIPYWETGLSLAFNPPSCELPAATEALYSLAMERILGVQKLHLIQLHIESEKKRSLLPLPSARFL